jgi:hypothetical protein
MKRDNFTLPLDLGRELIIDNFAGGGGVIRHVVSVSGVKNGARRAADDVSGGFHRAGSVFFGVWAMRMTRCFHA